MSDCPCHLTPEDTGERRRRTGLWIRLLGGHLREAVKVLLFSGGFTFHSKHRCTCDASSSHSRMIVAFHLMGGEIDVASCHKPSATERS